MILILQNLFCILSKKKTHLKGTSFLQTLTLQDYFFFYQIQLDKKVFFRVSGISLLILYKVAPILRYLPLMLHTLNSVKTLYPRSWTALLPDLLNLFTVVAEAGIEHRYLEDYEPCVQPLHFSAPQNYEMYFRLPNILG